MGLVSIHAPAWGATPELRDGDHHREVSIHAPAWGATRGAPSSDLSIRCFNPRSRVGSDREEFGPARTPGVFQSTLPRGERPVEALAGAHRRDVFQSTLPRGERHFDGYHGQRHGHRCFNPRSRVGSDQIAHGPVSGVTTDQSCFNPRSRVGSDPGESARRGPVIAWHGFNPRSRVGSDDRAYSGEFGIRGSSVSIHAPAWGATAGSATGLPASEASIHAPAWGATRWTRP